MKYDPEELAPGPTSSWTDRQCYNHRQEKAAGDGAHLGPELILKAECAPLDDAG